jgi:hypothetical protein
MGGLPVLILAILVVFGMVLCGVLLLMENR